MYFTSSWLRLTITLLALVTCCLNSGCTIFSSTEKTILVKEAPMNRLEILYLPGAGKPPVQISLMGSGNIRLRQGTSPQMANDFSMDVASMKWNDISVDQINVAPSEMRDIFQSLVDRGLLRDPDKDFASFASRGNPAARIIGHLNSEPVARLVYEPEILGYIRDMLKILDQNHHALEIRN